ncbi:MAG TPA: glycosyl hydrolase [Verrucomicrobiae bacterium]
MKTLRACFLVSSGCLAAVLFGAVCADNASGGESRGSLERNFIRPPASARPWVYWFWLNGNITSNGITADLEAMQRVGIGGVLIMEVDQGTPKGPAGFGTPPWRALFQHVCAEAHRLGLEVNMNNDAGWCGSGAPFITPDLAMQKLVWSETNIQGPLKFEGTLEQPKAVADYYRDIAVLTFPTPAGDARIPDIDGKAAFVPKQLQVTSNFRAVPVEQAIPRSSVRVITPGISADGKFSWDVPAGKWTVLRLGHTPTGKDNHPAPEAGRGLESDKLSKTATEVMFDGLMGKLIADSKRFAGKTLVSTHIDSWETGSQNWTPLFREEFEKRCGYDPLPFLPVVTGRVLDSTEISERFLWDLRHTVSDLLVENYAGHFRRLAHRNGLRLSIEAYDGTPCDDMTYAGQADEPMAEFWSWGYNTAYSCVEMSSAAHVYGRRILGAEAFTANDQERWLHHPATIKALGDWAFCEGINRFVFHRYALQPWLQRAPGMSMGPWGLHYERTQTWWEQSAAWHQYLARCQYLLRQGLFVADICFLEPEGSPMRFTSTMPWRTGNTPERPRYNFDGCSPEVVMTRMKVKNGRLVLPDGMSYRLLVLPQVETMSPALLRKIAELVKAGATVLGPAPAKSPGLANYPQCDEEIRQLAGQLWQGVDSVRPSVSGSSAAPRTVVWNENFRTPVAAPRTNTPLDAAKWIWHKEGNPAIAAPVGERFFRRVLDVPADQKVLSAEIVLTADNSFELWVNGKALGSGGDFKQSYRFDVKPFLKPGQNVICVKAVNGAGSPNPAGLIGAVAVRCSDAPLLQINTDAAWQTAVKAQADWLTSAEATDGWGPALELGALGMQPWGEIDKATEPPYVFPSFAVITNVLSQMGVLPDFEGDPSLRFIHRADKGLDIYFVANSQSNWLAADCAFRVAGRAPEVWDALTGETSQAPAWREVNGRTFMPLTFEPDGSRFVVFREPARLAKAPAVFALVKDGQNVLPEPAQARTDAPPAELTLNRSGGLTLLAWQPGRYEVKRASGSKSQAQKNIRLIEIPALPEPLELRGPWDVRFQPGRGAPEHVVLEQLTDWARHENEGVKYFSGTATYTKSFTVPAASIRADERQFLDLGSVAVMADVRLNGKDLGILWKGPYRVEITGAIRPGENQIEIKVVNLWINRMIGDEQLPEDSDRNANGTLKQWPPWVESDQPSPTGRFTFTSWRLWKKDSPLQPSGVLGPVVIVSAREVKVPF